MHVDERAHGMSKIRVHDRTTRGREVPTREEYMSVGEIDGKLLTVCYVHVRVPRHVTTDVFESGREPQEFTYQSVHRNSP